jgi:hypothetical protein
MKWDPSIWNYGRSMDKYCKVKDIVSSKCHKEMNGTWIANLYCLTVLLGGVHTLVAWPCTKCYELYAHSSSLDANQLKVVMETHWKQKNRQKTQRRLNWMCWNQIHSVGWSDAMVLVVSDDLSGNGREKSTLNEPTPKQRFIWCLRVSQQ